MLTLNWDTIYSLGDLLLSHLLLGLLPVSSHVLLGSLLLFHFAVLSCTWTQTLTVKWSECMIMCLCVGMWMCIHMCMCSHQLFFSLKLVAVGFLSSVQVLASSCSHTDTHIPAVSYLAFEAGSVLRVHWQLVRLVQLLWSSSILLRFLVPLPGFVQIMLLLPLVGSVKPAAQGNRSRWAHSTVLVSATTEALTDCASLTYVGTKSFWAKMTVDTTTPLGLT